jgi:hypothetical protein
VVLFSVYMTRGLRKRDSIFAGVIGSEKARASNGGLKTWMFSSFFLSSLVLHDTLLCSSFHNLLLYQRCLCVSVSCDVRIDQVKGHGVGGLL